MAEPLDTTLVSLDELFPDLARQTEESSGQEEDRGQESDAPVVRLSPDQQQRLLRQLHAHYLEATTGRDESQQRRETRYRRYLSDPDLRAGMQPWDDAPQLFLSMTRKTLEGLLDKFMGIFGRMETVEVKGFGEEDVAKSERKTKFFRWALKTLNEWRVQVKMVLQDAELDSLGVLKVYNFRQPFDAPFEEAKALQVFVQVEAVDIGTLLIPPDAEGLQWPGAKYMGHHLWITPDDFPSMKDRGFALPDEDDIDRMGGHKNLLDDERKLIEFEREGWFPETTDDEHDPEFEMVESYELFDIDDDGRREMVVVHWFPHWRTSGAANSDKLGHLSRIMELGDVLPQRAFPRPMWPFFPVRLWRQPRQLRGLNVPDRLESAQDLLNRLAEQMVHQGTIDILPYVFANVALTGDLPNLGKIKPGDIVPIDQIGGNVFFHTPNSSNRHYIEQMQVAKQMGEEDIPVTAFTQGRNPDQPNTPKTLGGLSLMIQQNNESFNELIKEIAEQFTPALKFAFALWQHRLPPNLKIPLPDTEGIEGKLFDTKNEVLSETPVSQEELSGLFDIRLKVNPNETLDQQKKLTLAEKLDALLVDTWPAGRRELWRDVWESLGLQEFDKFYPEEVALVETQIKILQAQLQIAAMEAKLSQIGQAQEPPQLPPGRGEANPSPFVAPQGSMQPVDGGQPVGGA